MLGRHKLADWDKETVRPTGDQPPFFRPSSACLVEHMSGTITITCFQIDGHDDRSIGHHACIRYSSSVDKPCFWQLTARWVFLGCVQDDVPPVTFDDMDGDGSSDGSSGEESDQGSESEEED
jgi:hypothetical protein